MTKTIAKNSPKRAEILANAKNIMVYNLSENDPTSGEGMSPCKAIMEFDIQVGKLKFYAEENHYRLSVHSNRFYDFTICGDEC